MVPAAGRASFPKPTFRLFSPLPLALAFLVALLCGLEWHHPGFFLHDDNATWFSGAYRHDLRTLMQTGRLAEVNYYQYGGEPFLEQGQTAVLYPPVYLAGLLATLSGDARWTIEWLAAMHLVLGMAGFYFWMRQGGIAPIPAALAGLAWVLNPFVLIVGSSWITVIYLAGYLPWIFWAMDWLLSRPGTRPAIALGGFCAALQLSGYPQWTAYTFLFLAIYLVVQLWLQRETAKTFATARAVLSASVLFLALTAPVLLPLLHAASASEVRAHALPVAQALFYRVQKTDLARAQVGWFRPHLVFGISTAILYAPALLALPLMILRFVRDGTTRRHLFPLLLLAIFAVALSTRWHVILTLTPFFERFRWPFKVFIFADFFLLASLVWTLVPQLGRPSSWSSLSRFLPPMCLVIVLVGELAVSLGTHDGNSFSQTTLPTSQPALAAGVDPTLGRVIAIDDILPEASASRFFSHCYSTFYAMPNLGGYDPLVWPEQLHFGLGLDFPNTWSRPITPRLRSELDGRAVRYWIVDPRSPLLASVQSQAGLRLLESSPGRLVYEDAQAAPLAFNAGAPMQPLPLTYAGNSLLITLDGVAGPVEVSLDRTDGWWARVDGGPWRRAAYADSRLVVDTPAQARQLEISYFDPRFRTGLLAALVLGIIFIALNRPWPPLRRGQSIK
jgi:hypothetical protein